MASAIKYLSNVAKSVKYASIDAIKDYNPVVFDAIETNQDFGKAAYKTIKNYKSTISGVYQKVKTSQVGELAVNLKRNIFEDLKNGTYYNKSRVERAFDEAAAKELGGFDDDFGFEDGDSFGGDSMDDLGFDDDGESALVDAIDSVGEKSSSAVGQVIARSAEYQVEATRQSTAHVISHLVMMNSGIRQDLSSINQNITGFAKFANEALVTHFDNSKLFYETTQKQLDEQTSLLRELVDIQKSIYTPSKNTGSSSSKIKVKDLFNSSGMINLADYFKYVQQNIKDQDAGYGDMMGMVFEMGIGNALAANPLGMIMTSAMKSFLPKNLKKSMEEFNKILGGASSTALLKITKGKNDFGIREFLGNMFGLDLSMKKEISTAGYNKGPVPWNGKDHKALTEVIPTLLSKIYGAVSGHDELRYNFDTGRFVKASDIRRDYNKTLGSYVGAANEPIIAELEAQIAKVRFENQQQKIQFQKDLKTIMRKNYNNMELFNPNDDSITAKTYGLTGVNADYNMKLIKAMWKRVSKGAQMQQGNALLEAIQSQNDFLKQLEESGDSVYTALHNGSMKLTSDQKKELKANNPALKLDTTNDLLEKIYDILLARFGTDAQKRDAELIKTLKELRGRSNNPIQSGASKGASGQRRLSTAEEIFDENDFNDGIGIYTYTSNKSTMTYGAEIDLGNEDDEKSNVATEYNDRIRKADTAMKKLKAFARGGSVLIKAPGEFAAGIINKVNNRIYTLFFGDGKHEGESIMERLRDGFTDWFDKMRTDFRDKLDDIKEAIGESGVGGKVTSMFKAIFGFDLGEWYSDLKKSLFGDEDESFFGGMRDLVKQGFSDMWEGVKKTFRSTKDSASKTLNIGGTLTAEGQAKANSNAVERDIQKGLKEFTRRNRNKGEIGLEWILKNTAAKKMNNTEKSRIRQFMRSGALDLAIQVVEDTKNIPADKKDQIKEYLKNWQPDPEPSSSDGVGSTEPANDDQNIPQSYRGTRRVSKTGVVAVSEGELILPSDYNPRNLAERKHKETTAISKFKSSIANKRIPKFAEGNEDLTPKERLSILVAAYRNGEISKEEFIKKIKDLAKADTEDTLFEAAAQLDKESREKRQRIKREDYEEGAESFGYRVADEIKGLGKFLKEEVFSEKWSNKISDTIAKASGGDVQGKGVEAAKDAVAHLRDYLPTMAASGLTGAALSWILGIAGGPILGGAVGAGVGLLAKSKKIQSWLFGEKVTDEEGNVTRDGSGVLSKHITDNIDKYFPKMAKGAIVGGITSILPFVPGGPVAGIVLGSAVGFAASNEKIKSELFGEGKTLDKIKNFVSKKLPKAAIGAGALALTGPFGLVTNMVVGAGLGLVSDTEKFKSLIFGHTGTDGKRHGGVVGFIKESLKVPLKGLKDLFNTTKEWVKKSILSPIKSAFKPLFQQFKNIGNWFKDMLATAFKDNITKPIGKMIADHIVKPMERFVGRLFKPVFAAIRGAISAPFRLLGAVTDRMRAGQLSDFGRGGGTAAEREAERKERDEKKSRYRRNFNKIFGRNIFSDITKEQNSMSAIFDRMMMGMSDEDLEKLGTSVDAIRQFKGNMNRDEFTKRYSREAIGKTGIWKQLTSDVWSGKLSARERKIIQGDILKGHISQGTIQMINNNKGFTEEQKQKLIEDITSAAHTGANAISEAGEQYTTLEDLKAKYGFDFNNRGIRRDIANEIAARGKAKADAQTTPTSELTAPELNETLKIDEHHNELMVVTNDIRSLLFDIAHPDKENPFEKSKQGRSAEDKNDNDTIVEDNQQAELVEEAIEVGDVDTAEELATDDEMSQSRFKKLFRTIKNKMRRKKKGNGEEGEEQAETIASKVKGFLFGNEDEEKPGFLKTILGLGGQLFAKAAPVIGGAVVLGLLGKKVKVTRKDADGNPILDQAGNEVKDEMTLAGAIGNKVKEVLLGADGTGNTSGLWYLTKSFISNNVWPAIKSVGSMVVTALPNLIKSGVAFITENIIPLAGSMVNGLLEGIKNLLSDDESGIGTPDSDNMWRAVGDSPSVTTGAPKDVAAAIASIHIPTSFSSSETTSTGSNDNLQQTITQANANGISAQQRTSQMAAQVYAQSIRNNASASQTYANAMSAAAKESSSVARTHGGASGSFDTVSTSTAGTYSTSTQSLLSGSGFNLGLSDSQIEAQIINSKAFSKVGKYVQEDALPQLKKIWNTAAPLGMTMNQFLNDDQSVIGEYQSDIDGSTITLHPSDILTSPQFAEMIGLNLYATEEEKDENSKNDRQHRDKLSMTAGAMGRVFRNAALKVPHQGALLGVYNKVSNKVYRTIGKIPGAKLVTVPYQAAHNISGLSTQFANNLTKSNSVKSAVKTTLENSGLKKTTVKVAEAVGEGAEKVSKSGLLKTLLNKLKEFLTNNKLAMKIVDFLGKKGISVSAVKSGLKGMFTALEKNLTKNIAKIGGEKLTKIAAKIGGGTVTGGVAFIAFALWDFVSGVENAGPILGVEDPTATERVIAGLVNALNNNLLLGIIPTETIISVAMSFLENLGVDMSGIRERQAAMQQEVAIYNAQHQTNLSVYEYLKKKQGFTVTGYIGNLAWQTTTTMVDAPWQMIKSVGGGAVDTVTGLGKTIVNTLSGNWSDAWEGLKQTGKGLWDMTGGALWKGVSTVGSHIWNAITGQSGDEEEEEEQRKAEEEAAKEAEENQPTAMDYMRAGVQVGRSFNASNSPSSAVSQIASTDTGSIDSSVTPTATDTGSSVDSEGSVVSSSSTDIMNSTSEEINNAIPKMSEQAKSKIAGMFGFTAEEMDQINAGTYNGSDNPLSNIFHDTGEKLKDINNQLKSLQVQNVQEMMAKGASAFDRFAAVNFGLADAEDENASMSNILVDKDYLNDRAKEIEERSILANTVSIGRFDKNGNKPLFNLNITGTVDDQITRGLNSGAYAGGKSGVTDQPHVGDANPVVDEFVSQKYGAYANQPFTVPGDGKRVTVADAGCAPAAATMAIKSAGYSAEPITMESAIKTALKYKQPGGGVTADYFAEEFANHGLHSAYVTAKSGNKDKTILNYLSNGNPVVLLGQDDDNTSKSTSPFGPQAHYVVATAYDKAKNGIYVNDPESQTPNVLYNASKLLKNSVLGIIPKTKDKGKAIATSLLNRVKNILKLFSGKAFLGDMDGDYIGKVSRFFESGKQGPAIAVKDKLADDGGGSFGSYQMIWKYQYPQKFWKKYGYEAKYGKPESAQWLISKWVEAANDDPDTFFKNEHEFVLANWYEPACKALEGFFDPNTHSRVMQECIWSWAIHTGSVSAANQFRTVCANNGIDDPQTYDEQKLAKLCYDYRYARCSAQYGSFTRYDTSNTTDSSEYHQVITKLKGKKPIDPKSGVARSSSTAVSGNTISTGDDALTSEYKSQSVLDTVLNGVTDLASAYGLTTATVDSEGTTESKTASVESAARAGIKIGNKSIDMSSLDEKYQGNVSSDPAIAQKQRELVARMDALKGTLKYAQGNDMFPGSRNPEDGSGDCSSTVQYVYKQVLGEKGDPGNCTASMMNNKNTYLVTNTTADESKLQLGDLILKTSIKPRHVEMYYGNHKQIGHGGGLDGKTMGPTISGLGGTPPYDMIRRYVGFRTGGSGSGIPLTSQIDSRYANMKIGDESVYAAGCAPAVATMMGDALGYHTNMYSSIKSATPYKQPGGGVTADYFIDQLADNGYGSTLISSQGVLNSLSQGKPVILMGTDNTNTSKINSPFGRGMHYVLATGYKNGNIYINDPEAKRANIPYNAKRILKGTSMGISPTISKIGSSILTSAKKVLRRISGRATVKVLFVGDSRTVGMKDVCESSSDIQYVAKESQGLIWLKSDTIQNKIIDIVHKTPGINVVFWLGVNDLDRAIQYSEFYSDFKTKLTSMGANVYFMSVGPIDEEKYKEKYHGSITNKKNIEPFNDTLKSVAQSKYIDIYTYLMNSKFGTTDGLHYDSGTSKEIYNHVLSVLGNVKDQVDIDEGELENQTAGGVGVSETSMKKNQVLDSLLGAYTAASAMYGLGDISSEWQTYVDQYKSADNNTAIPIPGFDIAVTKDGNIVAVSGGEDLGNTEDLGTTTTATNETNATTESSTTDTSSSGKEHGKTASSYGSTLSNALASSNNIPTANDLNNMLNGNAKGSGLLHRKESPIYNYRFNESTGALTRTRASQYSGRGSMNAQSYTTILEAILKLLTQVVGNTDAIKTIASLLVKIVEKDNNNSGGLNADAAAQIVNAQALANTALKESTKNRSSESIENLIRSVEALAMQ